MHEAVAPFVRNAVPVLAGEVATSAVRSRPLGCRLGHSHALLTERWNTNVQHDREHHNRSGAAK